MLTGVAEKVLPGSEVTAFLKTGRRARELWQKVTAAGGAGDDLLLAALKDGSPAEAGALEEAMRQALVAAQDAAGLERLAGAGTKAQLDAAGPLHSLAEARAIRLRPEIEKAADPDKSLLEALKAAALPGAVAWRLATAWQEAGQPELAKKAAAALKAAAPDDEANESLAAFLGFGESDTPEAATDKSP